MALSTKAKSLANAALRPLGAKLDSITAERAERARLDAHAARHGFEEPLYALSPGMAEFNAQPMIEAARRHEDALARLRDPARNAVGYTPQNGFFNPPDAEISYLMLRRLEPRRMIEIGSGHSTRIAAMALRETAAETPEREPARLIAIDPQPRAEIDGLVDRFERMRLEDAPLSLFETLEADDVLFIDSSHELRAGGDVAQLFCRILPRLAPGVVIHVHDVFLPFEYPAALFYENPLWGEQYALHALLSGGGYEVLWPGYYVQRTRPELAEALPFLADGPAQSFWMRKRPEDARLGSQEGGA
ncbi:MAG: class I SAM-dependent methyltransferase [Pseudomonadota bacterium]